MREEASNLNDVVVIGYQTVKRKDLTGSVSSVNAKQLKDIPLNSAAQALAGRLAGVQVTGSEGSPNAEVMIRVRGGGSITQDNSPLYIIDGIQVENGLATLSPTGYRIRRCLKDASATAIYGARGAKRRCDHYNKERKKQPDDH
jgi:outer membrane receptor for ferrienterochelin and colicin